MIVKATDIKNNFGKYLSLLKQEDIIVTKNGTPVARITLQEDWDKGETVCEQAAAYGKRMNYEEFMEMYENSEERYEYIDGEVYLLASPKFTHQRIVGNLYVVFHKCFQGKPCAPYLSPFDVTLKKGENMNVVQPDLLVICDPENRNKKDKYTGTPSLVLEVLSETTARKDLVKKLDLYMQSGVKEYWVVNYHARQVIVYEFHDRDIANMGLYDKEGTVKSFVFEGLAADMDSIFA